MHKAVLYAITGLILTWLTLLPLNTEAYPQHAPQWTKVEQKFLAKSMRQHTYPHEYIAVIDTRNQYDLGKLTALRFIEWVQDNPNGVVGFTCGATPEFFIKFLDFYKNNWHKPDVQAELQSMGIHRKKFPNTTNLRLVQLEEIYPQSDKNYRKLSNYTVRHYAKVLGIKPENLLLMNLEKIGIVAEKGLNVVFMNGKVDLTLLNRKPISQLELWQQKALKEVKDFCNEYEKKIRAWGGMGFIVAGINYGGQLGYNAPGVAADSKTHFVPLDYQSVIYRAKDYGGIDYARGKIAITVGLGTLTYNPNAVMIVIAAGEIKSGIVRDAIENKPNLQYPATVFQKYPNSRFYITYGATKQLDDRQTEDLQFKSIQGWHQKHIEEALYYVSLTEKKPLLSLTESDFEKHSRGKVILENQTKPLRTMLVDTHNNLIKKIEKGVKIGQLRGTKILHTSPHPEDLFVGYYPALDGFAHKYKNYYVDFTSGYNCVSDSYILNTLNRASDWWLDKEKDLIFNKSMEKILNKFKNSYIKQDVEQMNMLETTIAMKHLVSIYSIKNLDELKQTIRWLKDEYFPNKQPGDLDVSQIKLFKGMLRESEIERVWVLKNLPLQNVIHLRSKFYSGREFMRTPRFDSDVVPFINLYNKIKPDIITVQADPDSSPLNTNFRVLQIVAQALRSKEIIDSPNLQIIGYRTTWFRYRLADANMYVPITNHSLSMHKRVYNSCYNSLKASLFPSASTEGDTATMEKIHREQLADLKVLLGEEYFSKNPVAEIREAAGFMILNHMDINEFLRKGEDLQPAIDLEEAYIASKK